MTHTFVDIMINRRCFKRSSLSVADVCKTIPFNISLSSSNACEKFIFITWMYKTCILYTDIHCTWLRCRQMDNNKINSLTFLIFLRISLCLNFFHLLVQKPNLEKNSIHSNKFFIIFTCLNPVLLVWGFGQVGYTNTAVFRKIYLNRFFSKVPIPILVRI